MKSQIIVLFALFQSFVLASGSSEVDLQISDLFISDEQEKELVERSINFGKGNSIHFKPTDEPPAKEKEPPAAENAMKKKKKFVSKEARQDKIKQARDAKDRRNRRFFY